jgi:hypothetical protein
MYFSIEQWLFVVSISSFHQLSMPASYTFWWLPNAWAHDRIMKRPTAAFDNWIDGLAGCTAASEETGWNEPVVVNRYQLRVIALSSLAKGHPIARK